MSEAVFTNIFFLEGSGIIQKMFGIYSEENFGAAAEKRSNTKWEKRLSHQLHL